MENLRALLLLAKVVQREVDDIAREHHLHREQILLLMELEGALGRRTGQRRFAELVWASLNTPARTSQHLRGLLDAGLCEKEVGRLGAGEGSGSYAHYSMTPKGRELFWRLRSSLQAIESLLSPGASNLNAQAPLNWMRACRERFRTAIGI
ncbi:hypothetical protein [Ideonella sp. B508-1]|uniref:hypothetical protein n=1 Tax=Ideonella sp. B508-1 TaxID=137716 RepID=UPI0011D24783|nr:hypothetical protein [Ideonella sp. B508-1]